MSYNPEDDPEIVAAFTDRAELPRTLHDDIERLRDAVAHLLDVLISPPLDFISGIIFPDIDNDTKDNR